MQIYSVRLLNDNLRMRTAALEDEIQNEPKNQLLNVNESSYNDYIVQKYTIEPLELHWDQAKRTDYEKPILAGDLSPDIIFGRGINPFDARPLKQFRVVCHIPFSGDATLLQYRPMSSVSPLPDYTIHDNELRFEIADNPNNPDHIKVSVLRSTLIL